jgi:hypothetical protein
LPDFEEIKWETIDLDTLRNDKSNQDTSNPALSLIFLDFLSSVQGYNLLLDEGNVLDLMSMSGFPGSPLFRHVKIPVAHRHFAHLFNSYSKYFNNKYMRHGALFERPFQRIPVNEEKYLQYLVFYIHNNPVHHKFVGQLSDYRYSSYARLISDRPTRLNRSEVISWFGDTDNFRFYHTLEHDIQDAEKYLIE